MKVMGIDYGDARTGVAISDLLCTIVGTTAVVPSRNTEKAVADIVRMAKENQVGEIVVGLPKNMDGTEGPRAQLCREFAQILRDATGLPVGTNAVPLLRHTIFFLPTIIMAKNGKKRWTQLQHH